MTGLVIGKGANYKKVNRKMKKSEEKHTLTRNTEKSIAK